MDLTPLKHPLSMAAEHGHPSSGLGSPDSGEAIREPGPLCSLSGLNPSSHWEPVPLAGGRCCSCQCWATGRASPLSTGSCGSQGPRAAGEFLIQGVLSWCLYPEGSGISGALHQRLQVGAARVCLGGGGGVWLCKGGGSSLSVLSQPSLRIWV